MFTCSKVNHSDNKGRMRVACFTLAVMDKFPQQGKQFAGGNAFNQAIRFAQLGWETSFVGAIGTDAAGDELDSFLRLHGVDLSRRARLPGHTASNTIVNDGNGERFSVEGTWSGGVYDRFRLSEEDWQFLAGQHVWVTHANCPDYATVLHRKPEGMFLAVDFLHHDEDELIRPSLGIADLVFFGGTPALEARLAVYSKTTSSVLVLTLGSGGSVAFKGGTVYRQPALQVERVLDTTGCGDAFQAAFSNAYYRDRDIPAALLSGAESGRLATQRYGATG